MKIVVIGGTGLIGSKTVAILRQRGHEVIAASRPRVQQTARSAYGTDSRPLTHHSGEVRVLQRQHAHSAPHLACPAPSSLSTASIACRALSRSTWPSGVKYRPMLRS